MTYTIFAFLLTSLSISNLVIMIAYSILLATLICWPLYILWFMLKYKSQLETQEVRKKHHSLYQGIRTESLQALIYNAVFCARRLDIVLVNIFLSPDFVLTKFEQNHYLLKIFALLLIQSVYLSYIVDTQPHTVSIFNKLEFFNEGLIIVMCYIMISYSGVAPLEKIIGAQVLIYISLGITGLIVIANVFTVVKMSYLKCKMKFQKYK